MSQTKVLGFSLLKFGVSSISASSLEEFSLNFGKIFYLVKWDSL